MVRLGLRILTSLFFTGCSIAATIGNSSTTSPEVTSALSFSSSKWIWSSASATANAVVGLRKDFTPPLGKALISAEIIISGATSFNLHVNGEYLGSGTRVHFAERFCVDLLPSFNVFAVNATTLTSGAAEGGVIATILLTYSDGSTDTILSDATWRAKGTVLPLGWETLAFDDTTWAAATVVANYAAAGPWANVLPALPADPPTLSLPGAAWIWTDVVPASGKLPAGDRAFRRTFPLYPGQVPASATIIVAADNLYTLYVNGVRIADGRGFSTALRYTVTFATPPTELVLAAQVTNLEPSPAGLLLAMEVNMVPSGRSACTAGSFVFSDGLWRSTKGAIPAGFEQPGFDDSAWPVVVGEGAYGIAPWGTATIETVADPIVV